MSQPQRSRGDVSDVVAGHEAETPDAGVAAGQAAVDHDAAGKGERREDALKVDSLDFFDAHENRGFSLFSENDQLVA